MQVAGYRKQTAVPSLLTGEGRVGVLRSYSLLPAPCVIIFNRR